MMKQENTFAKESNKHFFCKEFNNKSLKTKLGFNAFLSL